VHELSWETEGSARRGAWRGMYYVPPDQNRKVYESQRAGVYRNNRVQNLYELEALGQTGKCRMRGWPWDTGRWTPRRL